MSFDVGNVHNRLLEAGLRKSYDLDYGNYCQSLQQIWLPLPDVPLPVVRAIIDHCKFVNAVGVGYSVETSSRERAASAIDNLVSEGLVQRDDPLVEGAKQVLGNQEVDNALRKDFSVVDLLSAVQLSGELKDGLVSIALSTTLISEEIYTDAFYARGAGAADMAGAIIGGTLGGGLAGMVIGAAAFSLMA